MKEAIRSADTRKSEMVIAEKPAKQPSSPIKKTSALALPFPLSSQLKLKNRIVKAAMSEALADRSTGMPTQDLFRLYEKFAAGGAGLLLTGNVVIDREGRTEPGNVVMENREYFDLLCEWAKRTQINGCQLWMQISHTGRQTALRITNRPLAPSPVALKGFPFMFAPPIEMNGKQIELMIERFTQAAVIAKEAGFSGVQIHAAHGYLVNQFLSPLTNQRSDEWGGSLTNRMRFLLEIIRRIRKSTGPSFGIAVKLNSSDFQKGGFDEASSIAVAQALEEEKIQFLEISGGNYERTAMMGGAKRASTELREAYFLEFARKIRKQVRLPILLTGGFRSKAAMEKAIEDGSVDLIGIGRPMCFEPDLPSKLINGEVDKASLISPRSKIRLLDGILQIAWYQGQMNHLARSGKVKLRYGKMRAILRGFAKSYLHNPFKRFFAQPNKSEFFNTKIKER